MQTFGTPVKLPSSNKAAVAAAGDRWWTRAARPLRANRQAFNGVAVPAQGNAQCQVLAAGYENQFTQPTVATVREKCSTR